MKVTDIYINDTESQLIESIMIRIPLQSVVISQELNSASILCGSKMIKTIVDFMNDEFELSGMDRGRQRLIEESVIMTHTIVSNVPSDLRENIIARYKVK